MTLSFWNRNKEKREVTPQKLQMNMTICLLIVIFLIYIIIKLFRDAPESGTSMTTTYIIIGVFCLVAAVAIGLTISNFVYMLRTGQFKMKHFLNNPPADTEEVPGEENTGTGHVLSNGVETAPNSEDAEQSNEDNGTDVNVDEENNSLDDMVDSRDDLKK
jgi:hypothetical protein